MNTKIHTSYLKLIVTAILVISAVIVNGQTINNGSFKSSRCTFCAASPWIIEEGSPDISNPGRKWSTTSNYEFLNYVPNSPDGGSFANFASNNSLSYNESIYQNITGLIKGATYSIEFNQINTGLKSLDNSVLYDDEGAFEVYIDDVLEYTSPSSPVQKRWVTHTFNFIANNTIEKIAFVAKQTNKGSKNSYGLYIGLDGVQFVPPLSLDLLNFVMDESTLFWSTENENNFSHFEVERKREEENDFQLLEWIDAKKGMNNDYSFEDNSHEEGKYFYRLKMIDKDGKFYYSKLIVTNYRKSIKNITIYPNPINSDSRIRLTGFKNEGVISIYDMIGKKIFYGQIDFSQDQNINYVLHELKQGTYLISARENNSVDTQNFKFIVK